MYPRRRDYVADAPAGGDGLSIGRSCMGDSPLCSRLPAGDARRTFADRRALGGEPMTPRVLLGHAVAAAAALLLSVRHARRLGISGTEAWRYFKKSTSLGLCLAGICPAATLRQVWLAGKAAFICCAYDVVTDWRSFHPRDFEAFLATLRVEQIDR